MSRPDEKPPLNTDHYRALAILQHSALVRLDGQWRCGLTRVADGVVDVLVAGHLVTHLFPGERGECIIRRQPTRRALQHGDIVIRSVKRAA
jgi:hypothetical protein